MVSTLDKADEKVLSIDSSLKSRKAISDILSKVKKRKKITFAELEEMAETLLGYGKRSTSLIIQDFLSLDDEDTLMRILYIIEYLNYDEFVNPLVYTILNRNVGNNLKASIINTLYNFNVDITSPILSTIFSDAESSFYLFNDQFFEDTADDESMLINALEWFFGLPYHKKKVILNRLRDVDDIRKVSTLEIMSHSGDIDLSFTAIDIIGSTKTYKSVVALSRIAAEHKGTPREARAKRGVRKLELNGINSELAVAGKRDANSLICYSSMIDVSGNYVLWLASPKELKPPIEVLCVLINEVEGIVDCFGSMQMTKKEFTSLINKAKKEDYFVKIDFEHCRRLIENAIFYNNSAGKELPTEFLFRKRILKCETLPAEHIPEFKGYDLDKIKEDTKLLLKSATVNDICGMDAWAIVSGDIFVFADKFLEIQTKYPPAVVQRKMEKLIEEVFCTLILPELDLIVKRLMFAADILRFDRRQKKHVKTILCAALNLMNPKVTPLKNPFIVSYILTNIKNAVETRLSSDKRVE